ncbi:MAG: transposase family protein, partial [Microcystis sp. M076S1]|uniref:transposase family protein n=1 Tax=Microcystis sp. M076S1 TaxID=2771127 RepID=UPI002586237B
MNSIYVLTKLTCSQRHPLWIVLLVIILGTMLGYSGYRELGEFAKNNRHRLSQEFNIIPER